MEVLKDLWYKYILNGDAIYEFSLDLDEPEMQVGAIGPAGTPATFEDLERTRNQDAGGYIVLKI